MNISQMLAHCAVSYEMVYEDKYSELKFLYETRLIAFIQKTQQLGEAKFANMESHSFGKLFINEWTKMFYKHLDHHWKLFGN